MVFLKKFGVICFLETLILRFVFLPYYRRYSTCVNAMTTLKFETEALKFPKSEKPFAQYVTIYSKHVFCKFPQI